MVMLLMVVLLVVVVAVGARSGRRGGAREGRWRCSARRGTARDGSRRLALTPAKGHCPGPVRALLDEGLVVLATRARMDVGPAVLAVILKKGQRWSGQTAFGQARSRILSHL